MKKGVARKRIVLGMIIFCLGTCTIPSITGDMHTLGVKSEKNEYRENAVQQVFLGNPPKEEWNKTFGGDADDAAYAVHQTKDGGYIVGGYTRSFGIALCNPWLIKTDLKGNEVWNKTYNYYSLSNISGHVRYVQQTNDGGYILGCSFYTATRPLTELSPLKSRNQGFASSMVLIKTDSNGKEQWNKTYAGIEYSWCYCVQQTTDGGFIATGGGNATSSGFVNLYVLKTSPNGTVQWLKSFGTNDMDEEGRWIQQTTDGGYIVTGFSDCDYATQWGKIWLIKTDANGNMVWDKKFPGTGQQTRVGPETYGNSVQQTSDHGFIIAGVMNNQGCLMKTDRNGTEQWRKNPFVNDISFFCFSGKQISDGGYIATGNGLIKTDALGNQQWNVTIPTPFTSGQQTSDGGFVIAGSTSGYYHGNAWLIKFGQETKTTFTITGGLGVHVKITNTGAINASHVAWQIHVQGGILKRINDTVNGTVDIGLGKSKTVGTGMLLGLGRIDITATVNGETKTASGTQLIFFTIVKK